MVLADRIARRIAGGGCSLLVLTGGPLAAQAPPTVELSVPAATFPEPFGSIAGLRQLPDGRVLVSDGLGRALVVVDLGAGTADTIGAEGQGPDEYREPDGLFALPGDSTLLVDLGNGRLTAIGPDLGFGPTEPIARDDGGRPIFVLPRGTDREGRIYFQRMEMGGPGAALPDSGTIVRWDRSGGRMAEVGRVRLQERSRATSGGPGSRGVMVRPVPYSAKEAWGVGRDGRVAVARVDAYRLEWIDPEGRRTEGPALEHRPIPIREADQREWLEAMSGGLRVGVTVDNGVRTTTFSRGGLSGMPDPEPHEYRWPETKPPFPGAAVEVAPDGTAWVRRHVPAGEPVLYDVFGPDGRRRLRVRLPAERRLVGFGAESLYLMRGDELGSEWLERHPLPGR